MTERSPVSTTRSYQATIREVCSVLGIAFDRSTETVALEATPDGLTVTVTPRSMTHAGIPALLHSMEQRLNEKFGAIMSAQDDINAAVAALTSTQQDLATATAQLGTDVTNIQAEIANLSAAGVDTSALNDAVAQLTSTQQSLDAAVTSVGNLAPVVTPPAG